MRPSGALRWATAFEDCPSLAPPGKLNVPPPKCFDSADGCASVEDSFTLRKYAKDIDDSLKEHVAEVRDARKRFERRACDYQYAEMEGKPAAMAEAYGPDGPMAKGGSYLHLLRKWSHEVHALHRACSKNGVACTTLLEHLKRHPKDDIVTSGGHGKTGSKLFKEFRLACQVGQSRSPVPNSSPVWCDEETGLCEQRSCRDWWRGAHPDSADPRPWLDDRIDYDDLKDACAWLMDTTTSDSDINVLQHHLQEQVDHIRQEYCSPKWVDGYCAPGAKTRHAECTLGNGQYCTHGRVMPKSEMNETSEWQDPFPENPIRTQFNYFVPLLLPESHWPGRRLRPRRRGQRAASAAGSFL